MQADTLQVMAAYALGLVATLCLASFLTPGHWWRRPTLRALTILVAGTWGLGSAMLWLGRPADASAASLHPAPLVAMAAVAPRQPTATTPTPAAPVAGRSYRVFQDLNLRSDSGVNARRLAVVPVGALVSATGARDGDWWQVRASVAGRRLTGWTSSLWLRRTDETRPVPEEPD